MPDAEVNSLTEPKLLKRYLVSVSVVRREFVPEPRFTRTEIESSGIDPISERNPVKEPFGLTSLEA